MLTRRQVLKALPLLLTSAAWAGPSKKQVKQIPASQAGSYVGQKVAVKGKVAQVARSKGHVYLNLEAPFPNNPCGIVVYHNELKRFSNLDQLKGRTIVVTGKVKKFNGKALVQLYSPSQLVIQ